MVGFVHPELSKKRSKKSKNKKIPHGPLLDKHNIPYDYIVIIDSGSSGSRVYVYNWPNPQHAFEAGMDVSRPDVKLVRAFLEKEVVPGADSDSDSDSDDEDSKMPENDAKKHKGSSIRFPRIGTNKKWHRKITPGLSTFNQSPQKVGKHHISYLLNLASAVVPKSEHRRTPIFLHATAGMRLIPPNEQEPILENVCQYLTSNSDFYMPDCKSHVNVIDGSIEGLYGWLSVNYLKGAFDKPDEHQHGKNHSTYGLLDMGGASTQVVFQPNTTEIEEHTKNLFRLSLRLLPELQKGGIKESEATEDEATEGDTNEGETKKGETKESETKESETKEKRDLKSYSAPSELESFVYSDTFLGFGMFQAHSKYIKNLLDEYRREHDITADTYRFRTPIPDPCLPKGYTFTGSVDDHDIEYTGSSNFKECLESIFPVLSNNTHTSGTEKFSGDCKQLGEEDKVSSCLLNDLIPSFDFDVNHFIGVSGYWDTINGLLASQNLENSDEPAEQYDYNVIYSKTSEFCSRPLNDLLEINDLRDEKDKIHEEELAQLCFKSSWILNFLHVGLGFPRFGIDEVNKDDKFKSLQLVEKVDGSQFSWTLGRAILYANDEYVQAFNNYTAKLDSNSPKISRPGYVFPATEAFANGAEDDGVSPRPMYTAPVPGAKYQYFDYEYKYKVGNESKWYIQPHRFYGHMIFVTLIVVALMLMLGRSRRQVVVEAVKDTYGRIKNKIQRMRGKSVYGRVEEGPIEMSSVQMGKDSDELFRIDDEA